MSEDKSTGEFALSQSVSHLLHRAQQMASDWFSRNGGEGGVTLRQFAVLAAVAEKPGQNQTDLVRATGVDRSTLADMISRMEKRGWVVRKTASGDARAKAVTLSAAGKKALAGATPVARGADAAVLEVIAPNKRDSFVKTLEQLAAAAHASTAAPAANKPAANKPAANKPAANKPAANKPAADKPAADKPSADKPAADKPAADKPSANKPAMRAKKPVVKKVVKPAKGAKAAKPAMAAKPAKAEKAEKPAKATKVAVKPVPRMKKPAKGKPKKG